jgi:hypothetical protein
VLDSEDGGRALAKALEQTAMTLVNYFLVVLKAGVSFYLV